MFVILVYDIHVKRVSKVMRTVRRYLLHVQKSVFEGQLTQRQLISLQEQLESIIVPEEDSVIMYQFDSLKYSQQLVLGKQDVNPDIL